VPGDFQLLAESLARQQISVSTVSIGGDADRDLAPGNRRDHARPPLSLTKETRRTFPVVVEEASVAAAATASHARPLVLHSASAIETRPTLRPWPTRWPLPPNRRPKCCCFTAGGDPLLSWCDSGRA